MSLLSSLLALLAAVSLLLHEHAVHVLAADIDIGTVTLLVGSITSGNVVNVSGSTARLNTPYGAAFDSVSGVLFVADAGNSRISTVDMATSTISATTVASRTNTIVDIAVMKRSTDSFSYLFWTEAGQDLYRYQLTDAGAFTGSATTLHSSFTSPGGIGTWDANARVLITEPTSSEVWYANYDGAWVQLLRTLTGTPRDVCVVESSGYSYVPNDGTHVVQGMDNGGNAALTAGSSSFNTPGDVDAVGFDARFNAPTLCTVSPDESFVFISDTGNQKVRRLHRATSTVDTVMNSAAATPTSYSASVASSPSFEIHTPSGIGFNGDGDTMIVVGAHAVFSVAYAGTDIGPLTQWLGDTTAGNLNSASTAARFDTVSDCVLTSVAPTSDAYVADTNNQLIKKIAAGSNTPTNFASLGAAVYALVLDSDQAFMYASLPTAINRVAVADGATTVLTDSTEDTPRHMAFLESSGALYAALQSYGLVSMSTPYSVVDTNVTRTIVDLIDANWGTGSEAVGVGIRQSQDTIYVATGAGNRVVEVTTGGTATIRAGSGTAGSVDGTGTAAEFSGPQAAVSEPRHQYLFVVDTGNNNVRRMTYDTWVVVTVVNKARATDLLAMDTSWLAQVPGPLGLCTTPTGSRMLLTGEHTVFTVQFNDPLWPSMPEPDTVTHWVGSTSNTGHADGTGTAALFDNASGCLNFWPTESLAIGGGNLPVLRFAHFTNDSVTTAMGDSTTSGTQTGYEYEAQFPSGISDLTVGSSSGSYRFLLVHEAAHCISYMIYYYSGNLYRAGISAGTCGSQGVSFTTGSTLLTYPRGITYSQYRNRAFVTHSNQVVQVEVSSGGYMWHIAGDNNGGTSSSGYADGYAANAQFNYPVGIVSLEYYDQEKFTWYENSQNLICDMYNGRLRKGYNSITTAAGTGGTAIESGYGPDISLGSPRWITLNTNRRLAYFTVLEAPIVRAYDYQIGFVTTVAGSVTTEGFGTDPMGPAFTNPRSLCFAYNKLYVIGDDVSYVSFKNPTVTGSVTRLPTATQHDDGGVAPRFNKLVIWGGSTTSGGATEGYISTLTFNGPRGVSNVDANGTMFVPQAGNSLVTMIDKGGMATTVLSGFTSDPQCTLVDTVSEPNRLLTVTGTCVRASDLPILSTAMPACWAGSTTGGDTDATGTSAAFTALRQIAHDTANDLYFVADPGIHKIKQITSAAVVTTIAGDGTIATTDHATNPLLAQIKSPHALVFQPSTGLIFFMQHYQLSKLTIGTSVAVHVGTSTSAHNDGVGTSGQFTTNENYMALDPNDDNRLFVADGNRIRLVNLAQAWVVTVINTANAAAWTAADHAEDGAVNVAKACWFSPDGRRLYIDGSHAIAYAVSDSVTESRSLTTTQSVPPTRTATSTASQPPEDPPRYADRGRAVKFLAGQNTTLGTSNGDFATAGFNYPIGMATFNFTTLYVADAANYAIRQVEPLGDSVSTFMGVIGDTNNIAGDVSATRFGDLHAIIALSDGDTLITQARTAGCFFKISVAQVTSEIWVGLCGTATHLDGTGTGARTGQTFQMARTVADDLYFGEADLHYIRKVVPSTAVVSTVLGNGVTGNAGTQVDTPWAMGYRSYADWIVWVDNAKYIRYTADGGSTTVQLAGTGASGTTDGVGSSASIENTMQLAVSQDEGRAYFGQRDSHVVRVVDFANGHVWTFAGDGTATWTEGAPLSASLNAPHGIQFSADFSRLYVIGTHSIAYIEMHTETWSLTAQNTSSKSFTPTEIPPRTPTPTGTDPVLPIRYSDRGKYLTFHAGNGTNSGSADGFVGTATFNSPRGMYVTNETVYVMDQGNNVMRSVSPFNGYVKTHIGSLGVAGTTTGDAASTQFNSPQAMALLNDGVSVIVQHGSGCLTKVDMPSLQSEIWVGTCNAGFATTDGTGTSAQLHDFKDFAHDPSTDDLYLGEFSTHYIRKITNVAVVSTVIGVGVDSSGTSGTGTTVSAPTGITYVWQTTTLVWADDAAYLRKSVAGSTTGTAVAGSGASGTVDGAGTSAQIATVAQLITSPDGERVYFTETDNFVRCLNLDSSLVWTFAGNGTAGWSSGLPREAMITAPFGLAFAPDNSRLYISGDHGISYVDFATETLTITQMPTVSPTGTSTNTSTASIGTSTATVSLTGTESNTSTLTLPLTPSLTFTTSNTTTLSLPPTPTVTNTSTASIGSKTATVSYTATGSNTSTPSIGTKTATVSYTATGSNTSTVSIGTNTATRSTSDSVSESESVSTTITPPPTPTRSFSPSISLTETVSTSPSASEPITATESLQPTESLTLSVSESVSESSTISSTVSQTASESESESSSLSVSSSASLSPSESESESSSLSASSSASLSASSTESLQPTESMTLSVSLSDSLIPPDPLAALYDPTGRTQIIFRRVTLARLDATADTTTTTPNTTFMASELRALGAADPEDGSSWLRLVIIDAISFNKASVYARVAFGSTDADSLTTFDAALSSAAAFGSVTSAPAAVAATATVLSVPDQYEGEVIPPGRRLAFTGYANYFEPAVLVGPTSVTGPTLVCSNAQTQFSALGIGREFTTATVVVAWSAVAQFDLAEGAVPNVTILQAIGSTTVVRFFDAGMYELVALAALENQTREVTYTVERRAPVSERVSVSIVSAPSSSANGREASVQAVAPSSASLEWSVLTGTAVIATPGAAATALEGTGEVTLLLTVNDPECGQAAYVTVDLTFAELPPCVAETTCGGHGTCLPSNACECYASALFGNYNGLDCSRCAAGFVGADCKSYECSATSCINGDCSADGTTCVCHRDATRGYWQGTSCTECLADASVGFFAGVTCNECAPNYYPSGTCGTFCSDSGCGNGACGAAGSCECFESTSLGFWEGPACDQCIRPYAGATCTETCTAATDCSGHGSCRLDEAANAYVCDCSGSSLLGFWGAADCGSCAVNYVGDSCTTFSSTDPVLIAARVADCRASCSSHGACDDVGSCICETSPGRWDGLNCDVCAAAPSTGYWGGAACSVCADGYYGASCSQACPGFCSGHGACLADGTCSCYDSSTQGRWEGASCDACAPEWYGATCTIKCNADSCKFGACSDQGGCVCYANATHGYRSGSSCTLCAAGYTPESNCTECAANYYGPPCVLCTSAETCSGHGSCNATGGCTCDNNAERGFWTGANCDRCVDGYLAGCRVLKPTLPAACDGKTDPVWANATWRDGFVGVNIKLSLGGIDLEAQAAAQNSNASSSGNATANATAAATPGCEDLFPAAILTSFGGAGLTCTFADATTLAVIFGAGATFGEVTAGSTSASVTLSDAAVFAKSSIPGCPVPVAGATLVVPLPATLAAASAEAATSTNLGPCDGITVDASASSTPSPRMRLSLKIVDAVAPEVLRSVVAATPFDAKSRIATVPAWAVPAGNHTLRLTVTDGITGLGGRVDFIIRKSSIAHPKVVINGPAIVSFPGAVGTGVTAEAFYSACYNATSAPPLTFAWAITDKDGAAASLPAATVSKASLSIAAGILPAIGSPYTAKVTATDAGSGGRGEAQVTLTSTYSSLTASLTSPAGPALASADATLQWTCSDPDSEAMTATITCTSGCDSAALTGLVDTSATGSSTLSGGSWAASGAAEASWLVTCTGSANRSATASATTLVTENPSAAAPNFTVTTAARDVAAGARWTATVRINGSAVIPAGVAVAWSCTAPCSLDLTQANVAPQGTDRASFVVAEDELAAGTYTFVVTVSSTDDSFVSGSASVAVNAFPPPSAGVVALAAANGVAGPLASMRVSASGYVPGAPSLLPLTYAVSHLTEAGVATELAAASPQASLDVRVPGTLRWRTDSLVVAIQDRLGGRTEVAIPLVRIRGETPAGSTLISDATGAARRGSEASTLGAVAAAAGADSSYDDETTETLASLITVPRGSGALAASAVASVASSGSVASGSSTGAVGSLANGLTAALQDAGQQGTRTSSVVATALGATASLNGALNRAGATATPAPAVAAGNGTNATNSTAGRRVTETGGTAPTSDEADAATTAAESAMGALDLAGSVLTSQAAEGESIEIAVDNETAVSCQVVPAGAASGSGVNSSVGPAFSVGGDGGDLESQSGGSATALCVGVAGQGNAYAVADPESNVASQVVSINARLAGGGGKLAVSNTSMRITLPLNPAAESINATSNVSCSFYNTTLRAYDSRGCREISRSARELVCECDHLTDFSVRVNKPDVGNFEDIKLAGIIYISVLTGLCIILLPIAFFVDQDRQRALVDEQFDRVAESEAAIAAGQHPPAYDVAADLGGRSWLQHFRESLASNHPWIAPFTGESMSNFTMPQRVMVLFVVVVTQLFANGLMYRPVSASDGAGPVVTQVIASIAISVPMALLSSILMSFWFVRGVRSEHDMRNKHMRERLAALKKQQEEEQAGEEAKTSPTTAVPVESHEPFDDGADSPKKPGGKKNSPMRAHMDGGEDAYVMRVQASTNVIAHNALQETTVATGSFLRRNQLRDIAVSCAERRRHLTAISLHALAAADSVFAKLDRPPQETFATRSLRTSLGLQAVSMREATAVRRPGFVRPCVALNVVLEAYIGHPDPFGEPSFPDPHNDDSLARELYGDEMHSCIWRLAIECVKERELALAEALFTMHLILELPDLFLVLFDGPPPQTLNQVLATVAAAAMVPTDAQDRMRHLMNVGRMWAGIYAHRLLFIVDCDAYEAMLRTSSIVTPPILSVLLGLDGERSPILGNGGVPYQLAAEVNRRAPAMGEVVGVSLEPVAPGTFRSLIMQAHAFRLSPKPFLLELWQSKASQRIRLSRASPLEELTGMTPATVGGGTPPKTHSCAKLAEFRAARCPDIPPHMQRLSLIAEVLATIPELRIRQEKRHALSFFAYTGNPSDADLGATSYILRALNKQYYDQLYLRETTHGNFYATIECGRLMAMLLNRRTGAHETFDSFARAYQREVNDLLEVNSTAVRYDMSLPSWRHAAGSGRRDPTREIIGSNILPQTGTGRAYHDPVLHSVVMQAAMDGELAVSSEIRRAMTTTATRVVAPPARIHEFPLASLARFHPPASAGCGTPTTPHIGITAGARAARIGERIELLEGNYMPVGLRHIAGTLTRPLVISPFGYDAMLQQALQDEAATSPTKEGADPQPQAPAAGGGADQQQQQPVSIEHRPLRPAERSSFHRCIVASPLGATAQEHADAPVFTLSKCSHLRVRGLELRRGTVGAVASGCSDVVVEHCVVSAELPSSSDMEIVMPEDRNDISSPAGSCTRVMHSGGLPAKVVVAGYITFVVLYVFFALFSLFLTAALEDDEANQWLLQVGITTLVMALIIQPVTSATVATFSMANEIVFVALSQLITSFPNI